MGFTKDLARRKLRVLPYPLNSSSGEGGGIYQGSGTTEIISSTISGNSADRSGGGFSKFGGTTTIKNSNISGNSTDSSGGGIFAGEDDATIEITDSTISGNSANRGGGVLSILWYQRYSHKLHYLRKFR